MRAVLSCEPLTKRIAVRRSGAPVQHDIGPNTCVRGAEGAQDGAVVDVEELGGLVVRAGERVLVVGQRHDGAHPGCAARRCSRGRRRGATRGRSASSPPLRIRWPSGIAATAFTILVDVVSDAGAHEALAGDAPHLDVVLCAAADDVLAVARHRHRVNAHVWPSKVWTSVPSTLYSAKAIDLDPVNVPTTTKCMPSGSHLEPGSRTPLQRSCARGCRRASTSSQCRRPEDDEP